VLSAGLQEFLLLELLQARALVQELVLEQVQALPLLLLLEQLYLLQRSTS
jgi:hypothetical protein